MKTVITAAGAAYILLCVIGALMFTSCAASKNSCHGNGRKYYVAKDVRKAQSRHSAYRH